MDISALIDDFPSYKSPLLGNFPTGYVQSADCIPFQRPASRDVGNPIISNPAAE